MRSILLSDVGRLQACSLPVPEIGPRQVLVRVRVTGVCGSDVSTYLGSHPYKRPPVILGHELCGVVEAVGAEVGELSASDLTASDPTAGDLTASDLTVGDKVCASSFGHCERCAACLAGRTHLCHDKVSLSHGGRQGSFADYVVLESNMAYRLSPSLDDSHGALVEPLTIGLHAVRLAMRETPRRIAVLGAGNIGSCCLLAAACLGAETLVAVDLGADKGRRAMRLGADAYVDAGESADPATAVRRAAGSAVDVTLVAAGYPGVLDQALDATRPGGTIVVVSYFADRVAVDLNRCVLREIRIVGSTLSTPEDFATVIEWLETGRVDPAPLITHRLPLDRADKAFRLMTSSDGSVGKILLELDAPVDDDAFPSRESIADAVAEAETVVGAAA